MVVSQFVNWGIGSAGLGDATWRWMLGAEAVPALAFTLLTPFLDESPRWLRSRETRDSADGSACRPATTAFFSRANLRPVLLAFCVAMFNQLSVYFSQPQKVLNRVTFSQSKGAVGHNKERTN